MKKLGTITLNWFEFKDGKIVIKEEEIKKATKTEAGSRMKSVVALLQKNIPKKSKRAHSTNQ